MRTDLLKIISSLPLNDSFCDLMAELVDEAKKCLVDPFVISHAISANPKIDRLLGFGSFATAYLGIDGYVYKVNSRKNQYDTWLSYAERCIQSNPMMPRVYQIGRCDKTYCSKMERLTEYTDEFWFTKSREDYLSSAETYMFSEEGPGRSFEFITEIDKKADLGHYSEVVGIIKEIYSSSVGTSLDLHIENVMHRDGTLVISDPLAWGSTPIRVAEHEPEMYLMGNA